MLETVTYDYNLQNRLERVETDDQSSTVEITEYKYNPDGVRVSKHSWTETSGVSNNDDVYTNYLIDVYNHTGYAQVFVEDDGTNQTSYIIGDDILAQATNASAPEYLLYDGHGSTRQVSDNTGATIVDSFSYDAYGVMLGGNPASPPVANLLYAGEHFDTDAQHYYNRARWYDTLTGRFNRMDPFAGNNRDPQSLHKYLYAHCNPVMNVDPSGKEYTAVGTLGTLSIGQIVFAAVAFTYVAVPDFRKAVEDVVEQEIKLLIAMAVAMGMSLQQLYDTAKSIVERLSRSRRKEIYLHYSYKKFKVVLSLLSMGLWEISPDHPEGSFATKDIYLTGWTAKYRLAILHVNPPDAVYLVWPKEGFEPTSEGEVTGKFDLAGRWMQGKGYQYIFGKGSGGFGTVIGPIPMPRGSYGDW